MALDQALLQSSLDLVVSRRPDVTHVFYDKLFASRPAAEALFGRHSREAQERMLADALVAVVEHVNDPEWLMPALAALGAKHAEYGVTPQMYDWVGESLLATLAEVAGSDWTPELAAAWTDAYGAIVGLMLAGNGEA